MSISQIVALQMDFHLYQTLVPPVMLLGSELSFKVIMGERSSGGGGVGALVGGEKSDNLLEMNFDNFASLCNVEASSEASVGLD